MRAGDAAFEELRKAIDELAAADASTLVTEARIEARSKVRGILAEAMAQALLERSRVELGAVEAPGPAPAPPEPQPEPTLSPMTTELGWYVYGVVAAPGPDLPEEVRGVDDRHEPVVILEGGLAAVASEVPLAEFGDEVLRENLNDVGWLEHKARAHERVLDAIGALTTVIPMRLCTIYRTEAAVREMLARERRPLEQGLERFAARSEWGLKLFARPSEVERAATRRNPELGAPDADASGGEAYLRRKQLAKVVGEEVDRLVEDCAGAVHDRLSTLADESVVNPVQRPEVSGHDGEMVLNGVYLIADAAVEEFHVAVAALREEYESLGFDLVPTGPWPPYNFVKGSIEAAW